MAGLSTEKAVIRGWDDVGVGGADGQRAAAVVKGAGHGEPFVIPGAQPRLPEVVWTPAHLEPSAEEAR